MAVSPAREPAVSAQEGCHAEPTPHYDHESSCPFDVLGAQTEGMIGYLLERELRNDLGSARTVATIVTMTEVVPYWPAGYERSC